jgi:hypothetical protein
MIEITEKTVGLWRVELPATLGGNIMLHLACTDEGLARHRIDVTSRMYVDDIIEAHKSQDRRAHWEITTNSSREAAIAKCRKFVETYGRQTGGEHWELLRGGRTIEEFTELLATMPGMTAGKLLTEEEFRELVTGPLEPEPVGSG